jgi:hypothetical protein
MSYADKKIWGLVKLLNKVDYIKTNSSCEGHFKDGVRYHYNFLDPLSKKEKSYFTEEHNPAYVMFEIKPEKRHKLILEWELERMIAGITAESYKVKDTFIQITKRYHYPYQSKYFLSDWRMNFVISPVNAPASMKRKMTDMMIKNAENAVRNYLKYYEQHPVMHLLRGKKSFLATIEKIRKSL